MSLQLVHKTYDQKAAAACPSTGDHQPRVVRSTTGKPRMPNVIRKCHADKPQYPSPAETLLPIDMQEASEDRIDLDGPLCDMTVRKAMSAVRHAWR